MLNNAHIALNDTLLCDLFVFDVYLEQNSVDELSLRRLRRPPYKMIYAVEQDACYFALPEALIFANSCDLMKLHLDELYERLKVVLYALTIL